VSVDSRQYIVCKLINVSVLGISDEYRWCLYGYLVYYLAAVVINAFIKYNTEINYIRKLKMLNQWTKY